MSVILTGMGIPENCGECGLSYKDNYFSKDIPVVCPRVYSPLGLNMIEKLENCPLKSVEGLLKEIESRKDMYHPENEDKSDDTPIDYGTRRGLSIAIKIIKEYCGMED